MIPSFSHDYSAPFPQPQGQMTNLPHDESELIPDTLTAGQGVLKVVNRPAAVLLWQLRNEFVVILLLGCLQDNDGLLVVR